MTRPLIPRRRDTHPRDVDDPTTPARRPTRRELERSVSAEMLHELVTIRQTMTQYAGRLGGQVVNDVLASKTIAIPAEGYWTEEYGVQAGSIEVVNLSAANDVTVHAAPPASYVPQTGTGVGVVPKNTRRVLNLASRVVTIYGTAGDRVSFQTWTRGAPPGVS